MISATINRGDGIETVTWHEHANGVAMERKESRRGERPPGRGRNFGPDRASRIGRGGAPRPFTSM
jgi:hypothetical protein